MICEKEGIFDKVGTIILIIVGSIFFALATRTPEAIGESDDYMLTTVALENHFSLEITEGDIEDAKRDFPEHAWYFQSSWDSGMPALFSVEEGEVYPWYMGTYSLACIPMKQCLEFLGLNQSYAFALTNAFLATLALAVCWYKLKVSSIKRLLIILMLGFSPIWWYIRWPSAEVFIFSMVVMSLAFFVNKNYHMAGLLVSLAGTLNIAVMAYGLFIIIDYVKRTYSAHALQGEKNVWKIMNIEKKSIVLLVFCFLPSLITPIFNLLKFGLLNLQSILGFATAEGYICRVLAHLFDLNIGFLPYFFLAFVLFCILIVVNLFRRRWSALIYLGAFLGTVMLYSVTYHVNSGMSGLPRYSAWTFPIFVFYIVVESELSKRWVNNVVTVLLLLSTIFTVKVVRESNSELEQTSVAKWVLNNAPGVYNPYYPIFISRVTKISGGYTPYQEEVPEAIRMGNDYESYLPVIYCDNVGNIRKILSTPEIGEKTLDYVEGTEEEIAELTRKIQENSTRNELYYINLSGSLKIKDKYINKRFAYTYGDVLKDAGGIPLSFFKIQGGGEIREEGIVVPSGCFQFGPYMPLEKGRYQVTITGDNLLDFMEDALIDNQLVTVNTLEKSNDTIIYILDVQWDAKSIELRGLNQGENTVKINRICLNKMEE